MIVDLRVRSFDGRLSSRPACRELLVANGSSLDVEPLLKVTVLREFGNLSAIMTEFIGLVGIPRMIVSVISISMVGVVVVLAVRETVQLGSRAQSQQDRKYHLTRTQLKQ